MAVSKFKDAFKFDPTIEGELPFFAKLLSECQDYDSTEPMGHVEDISWVRDSLSHIRRVCEAFDFKVIMADLTIIQDERLADRNGPYLVSYVACFEETGECSVLSAYNQALEGMRDAPIVPNMAFYKCLCAQVGISIHPPGDALSTTGQVATYQSALRRKYRYDPKARISVDVDKQLQSLVEKFTRELKHWSFLVNGTTMIAVPFHRSSYQPALANRNDVFEGATPGGGLFIAMKPRSPGGEINLERCITALQSLLTHASLTESYTHLGMQIAERDAHLEAMEILSTVTHEIASLFKKQFKDVRIELEKMGAPFSRFVHAWDSVYATAELGYLHAKAWAANLAGSGHGELRLRFSKPLAELYRQNQLQAAVNLVAKRVYVRETEGRVVIIPQLEERMNDFALTPEQYAACYMLTAEPIRNLVHMKTACRGEWSADFTQREGLLLRLDHPRQGYPESASLDHLNSFLQAVDLDEDKSYARMTPNGQNGVRWEIRISQSLLNP